jgi:hypothetical protein
MKEGTHFYNPPLLHLAHSRTSQQTKRFCPAPNDDLARHFQTTQAASQRGGRGHTNTAYTPSLERLRANAYGYVPSFASAPAPSNHQRKISKTHSHRNQTPEQRVEESKNYAKRLIAETLNKILVERFNGEHSARGVSDAIQDLMRKAVQKSM